MERPQRVLLTCPYCGHSWQQEMDTLLADEAIIYKGPGETVERRVQCPRCPRTVIVAVPQAWLPHE